MGRQKLTNCQKMKPPEANMECIANSHIFAHIAIVELRHMLWRLVCFTLTDIDMICKQIVKETESDTKERVSISQERPEEPQDNQNPTLDP